MHIKAENPVGLLPEQVLVDPVLRLYFAFNHLKQLYRQGWLQAGIPEVQCESVAEHTLGVIFLALLLARSDFPHLDFEKLLMLALLHDFGEIFAGDITPADGLSPDEKHRLENASVRKVFSGLPQGPDYLALWQEYEEGETDEARLVREIDRLEMGLQACVYEQQGWDGLGRFFYSASQALSEKRFVGIMDEIFDLRRRGQGGLDGSEAS